MAETIYFISEKTLREQSLINDNVEGMFLNSAIYNAQVINLQEVIGSELYNSLCEQVKEGEMRSEYYETLMDNYITPYLVNRVMSDICIPLHYKMRNAGIVMNSDQHYQTANLSDIQYVKEYYEHNAVFNANRIVEYIL